VKKTKILFAMVLCVYLLQSCAGSAGEGEKPPSVGEAGSILTCRIVAVREDGGLLLAKCDGGYGDIYTLSVGNLSITDETGGILDASALRPGILVNIGYSGSIAESYPGQLVAPSAITVSQIGFDDRCRLYTKVLEDLWAKDEGLNDGLIYLGIDLSTTSLSKAEQAAVAWDLSGRLGLEVVQGTWQELIDNGYITATPLTYTGSGTDLDAPKGFFYEWEDGCLLSITEKPVEGTYSLLPVCFDAQKWRSSLGAYVFYDCTSVQSALGQWGEYTVGSHVIS